MIKDRETRLKYYREYRKAQRKQLESAGLCIICGKNPAPEGMKTCRICRKRISEKRAAK